MLNEQEQLRLQQLRLREWGGQENRADEGDDDRRGSKSESLHELPALTEGIELYRWQQEAADAWFEAGRRGTIKVVTGAGKTIAALAIVERLRREDPELRIAVVVPTIVLMEQWYDGITRRFPVPRELIGRLGGGHRDDLKEPRRILIAVLASARKTLASRVREAGVGSNLLLIVDESHRAGAPEMAAVLETERAYSLGLSATPERGDGEVAADETALLWDELGEVVYEMTFADAIRDGILPPFRIDHFGLPLNATEAQRYQNLTHDLNDARRELTALSPAARQAGAGSGLLAWARRVSGRSGSLGAVASRFVNDTTRRKQLLYKAESRAAAALALVQQELAAREGARVILFHESIDEVIALFERMEQTGIPVVMEHSNLPADLRSRSLELFRSGSAQVIVSARSLIEGFDVPEADLGIVVASSSSPRQRIQSIGRVLRKHRDGDVRIGEEKASRICVLYVRDTTDETIYERQNWDRMMGLDRNRYFHWNPPDPPVEQEGPPRAAVPSEEEIDLSTLSVGAPYPGRYRGEEFSTDRLGNVVAPGGAIALNPQEIPSIVESLRGGPGRFRITPERNALLVRVPTQANGGLAASRRQLELIEGSERQLELPEGSAEWVTRFGGVLGEPFRFPDPQAAAVAVDVAGLAPGASYRGPLEPAAEFRFRQRQGGVIAKRVRGGELFAHGPNADRLVAALRDRVRAAEPVTRFHVNELGHAFWREAGEARFLAALDGDLEFPERAT